MDCWVLLVGECRCGGRSRSVSGLSRAGAEGDWNAISSLATLPGAIIAYFAFSAASSAVPFVLAVSAARFVYIASADLIPGLHRQERRGAAAWQVLLVLAGVGSIALLRLHG